MNKVNIHFNNPEMYALMMPFDLKPEKTSG